MGTENVTAPEVAINFLKEVEGLRLEAYMDMAANPTIGYGHKLPHGSGLNLITEAQAVALLQDDANTVAAMVSRLCKVPVNVNQFSALISFAYNVGGTNYSTSTLLKRLNANDYVGASQQFAVWNKVTINGKRQVSPGLVARRAKERALFLTEPPSAASSTEQQTA